MSGNVNDWNFTPSPGSSSFEEELKNQQSTSTGSSSSTLRNVHGGYLSDDYLLQSQQQLFGTSQPIGGGIGSNSSSFFNVDGPSTSRNNPSSSFMFDDTYGGNAFRSSFDFDQTTTSRPYSPSGSIQGRSSSAGNNKQVGVVNPRPSSTVEEGVESRNKLLESSKSNVLSIINLLNEHVLSHPFVVFRRQAQVNNRSLAFHLTPFTVIPFMVRIQGSQGIGAFFKGLPSSLVNYVLLIGSESLFYNLLQYPIEYDFGLNQLFSERLLKHLLLKSLSILVVTPFICSSSVETVQSLIVAESPSPLDSIKEGFSRVFHFKSDRKLPFYMLVGPSIAYHLAYYVIYSMTKEALLYMNRKSQEEEEFLMQRRLRSRKRITRRTQEGVSEIEQNQQAGFELLDDEQLEVGSTVSASGTAPGSETKNILNELKCSLYANIITDIALYPFQTILYRCFLQGTRTLIDNVDGRTAVIPLISNYDSAGDCYQSVLKYEGTAGLFKGFGALILQYAVQASLIHLANYCVESVFNG